MTETAAVILARGGSKGVLRKNLRQVGGRTLVTRAVSSCLVAGLEVFVSTDDQEIAAVAIEAGANVINRPSEFALDSSPSEPALIHALGVIGNRFQFAFLVQPTSPFIDPKDLRTALSILESTKADSVFSACEDHAFRWSLNPTSPVAHSKLFRPRRQDLPATVRETGAFYGFQIQRFLDEKTRFCGTTEAIIVDYSFAVDIDTEEDLRLANVLLPLWEESSNGASMEDANISAILQEVQAIAYDFDGVMTDNRALMDERGQELVFVNRADGLGVEILNRLGIRQAIISTETNPVVSARARKLNIACFDRIHDKGEAIRRWSNSIGVPLTKIAFVGNDLNDMAALKQVGIPMTVLDGHASIKEIAKLTIPVAGGLGVIRYLADAISSERIGG